MPRVESATRVAIRCLGGFEIRVDDRRLDLDVLKPRVKSTFRFLAISSGRLLHREILLAALWPDLDTARGTRCLHVALSAIRHVLESDGIAAAGMGLRREATAYSLVLPRAVSLDLIDFEEMVDRANGFVEVDQATAAKMFRRALSLYTGDLLPEEGPAEWVVPERERLQGLAVDAAVVLAQTLIAIREFGSAVAICTWGLRLDRYRDELWQIRIAALETSGRQLAAARARRNYGAILTELGLAINANDRAWTTRDGNVGPT